MKKSTIFALIAFAGAVIGALVAVAAYIKKKEENLKEYEEMLLNEDYLADYMPSEEGCCCCEAEYCEEECHAEECCEEGCCAEKFSE